MQRHAAANERVRSAKSASLCDDRQVLQTLYCAQRYSWLNLADQPDAHGAGGIEQSACSLAARAEQPAEASCKRQKELRERAAQRLALAEVDPFAEAKCECDIIITTERFVQQPHGIAPWDGARALAQRRRRQSQRTHIGFFRQPMELFPRDLRHAADDEQQRLALGYGPGNLTARLWRARVSFFVCG